MSQADKTLQFRSSLGKVINDAIASGAAATFIISELATAEFDLRCTLRELQREQDAMQLGKQIISSSGITLPPGLGGKK